MNHFRTLRVASVLTILLLALPLVTANRPVAAKKKPTNPIVGKYDWFFSNTPDSDLRHYGTVEFKEDGTMSWDGGGTGTWEGPMKRGVLLRWKKGAIDMLELSADGGTLKGKNAEDTIVEGSKRGRRDSIVGPWDWAYGPAGNLKKDGQVDFNADKSMKWTTDGGKGTWSGPMKEAVLLRWKTGKSEGSIDMLEMKGGGLTLVGKNAKNIQVAGEKQTR
jgi:hypothetical protein